MKKKRRNKSKQQRPAAPKSTRRRSVTWAWALAVAAAAVVLYYGLNDSRGQGVVEEPRATAPGVAPQAASAPRELPPFHKDAEQAKPLPHTLDPSRFPISFVARAYAIAEEIPDVLAQQPCYCNCGAFGHQSLLDCFASDHGAACTVCLKEAFLAEQMTRTGKTPQEIRDAIVKGLWRIVDLESL